MGRTTMKNGKSADQIHKDLDNLKEDLGKLRDNFQRVYEDTTALGRDGGQHLAEYASERGQQVAESSKICRDKLRDTIHEQPMICLGAAVGIGLITGMMLRK